MVDHRARAHPIQSTIQLYSWARLLTQHDNPSFEAYQLTMKMLPRLIWLAIGTTRSGTRWVFAYRRRIASSLVSIQTRDWSRAVPHLPVPPMMSATLCHIPVVSASTLVSEPALFERWAAQVNLNPIIQANLPVDPLFDPIRNIRQSSKSFPRWLSDKVKQGITK